MTPAGLGPPSSPGITAALLSPDERRVLRRRNIMAKITGELSDLQPYRLCTHLVTFLAMLAFLGFIYTGVDRSAFSSALFPVEHTDYGAVIDAGSHGNRLHLFSWPARIHDPEHPLSGPVSIPKELFVLRAVPSIGSMAANGNNPAAAGETCIAPLVAALRQELEQRGVPEETWGGIPIFLKATAGMRSVAQSTRTIIMNSVRDYLETTPFTFRRSWARITAGEEEGVYGWLSVNNAAGTLFNEPDNTVGALDMGGASIQMTFSPLHTSVLEGYYGMNLGGQERILYSHSFIGFGWGDAMMRLTTRAAVETVLETLNKNGFEETETNKFLTYLFGQHYAAEKASSRVLKGVEPPSVQSVNAQKIETAEKEHNVLNGIKMEESSPLQTAVEPPRVLFIKAKHPCYPKGHKFDFPLPSIVYPEGRFYIDLDIKQLMSYMQSTGVPRKYLTRIIPHHRSPPSTAHQMDDDELFVASSLKSGESHEKQFLPVDRKGTHSNVSAKVAQSSSASAWESFEIAAKAKLNADPHSSEDEDDLEYPLFLSTLLNEEAENGLSKGDGFPFSRHLQSVDTLDASSKPADAVTPTGQPSLDQFSVKAALPPVPLFQALDEPLPPEAAPKIQWVIRFRGGGDFEQCQKRARDLFYAEPCFIHSCSFNGVYQPRLEHSKFIAFGQYSKVRQALEVPPTGPLDLFERGARDVCGRTRKQLRRARKQHNKYLPYGKNGVMNLCWKATWAHTLLTWGFGFDNQSEQITFAKLAEDETATVAGGGWAIGSMIAEVNAFPWKTPIARFEVPFLFAAVATILLVISTWLLLVQVKSQYRILDLAGLTRRATLEETLENVSGTD